MKNTQSANKSKLFQFGNDIQKLYVAGDLHGDYLSYQAIIKTWEKERDAFVLFLGDYADRGKQGLEILESLMKLVENERVIVLKGNHEDYPEDGNPTFSPCNLVREVGWKKGDWNTYYRNTLKPFFDQLYIAAILPGQILFVHGGISKAINDIFDLRQTTSQIEKDILWGDPTDENGEHPSRRGIGHEFGPDITEQVINGLNVGQIIRSHQPGLAAQRPYFSHDNKIMTISSTRQCGDNPYYIEIDIRNRSFSYQVRYLKNNQNNIDLFA